MGCITFKSLCPDINPTISSHYDTTPSINIINSEDQSESLLYSIKESRKINQIQQKHNSNQENQYKSKLLQLNDYLISTFKSFQPLNISDIFIKMKETSFLEDLNIKPSYHFLNIFNFNSDLKINSPSNEYGLQLEILYKKDCFSIKKEVITGIFFMFLVETLYLYEYSIVDDLYKTCEVNKNNFLFVDFDFLVKSIYLNEEPNLDIKTSMSNLNSPIPKSNPFSINVLSSLSSSFGKGIRKSGKKEKFKWKEREKPNQIQIENKENIQFGSRSFNTVDENMKNTPKVKVNVKSILNSKVKSSMEIYSIYSKKSNMMNMSKKMNINMKSSNDKYNRNSYSNSQTYKSYKQESLSMIINKIINYIDYSITDKDTEKINIINMKISISKEFSAILLSLYNINLCLLNKLLKSNMLSDDYQSCSNKYENSIDNIIHHMLKCKDDIITIKEYKYSIYHLNNQKKYTESSLLKSGNLSHSTFSKYFQLTFIISNKTFSEKMIFLDNFTFQKNLHFLKMKAFIDKHGFDWEDCSELRLVGFSNKIIKIGFVYEVKMKLKQSSNYAYESKGFVLNKDHKECFLYFNFLNDCFEREDLYEVV